ncbi:DcaP family trimeric outer membrane transporter [Dyella acidisoli]|uniref:Porin n=1 Tax=Dyella acidisoli TaxID=1867834 RepID=A0ABQ5XP97_9GAMM|nr:DcaP family trimeric outer membrane transporter [Dyella acidisoli]GLQ93566.1 hypothetical protein GCM10007901_25170 [Dyella acidisoli]
MERMKCLSAALIFALLSPPVLAQQDRTQHLQQEVDELKATVQALQAEVKALKAERTQVTAASTSTPSTAPAPLTEVPSSQVDALQLTHAEHSPLPPQQSVSEDQDSASRIDNEAPPTDPTLKGFIQIPGTETIARIGGYAKLDMIYDTRSMGSPDAFATASIPVPATRDRGNFNLQARQTRFSLDIRRPTLFDETLRFYFENDFFGGGNGQYGFRLRQAYGQLGNTYAGFGWSSLTDVDAIPDTLDFAGPNSVIAPRRAGIHQFLHLGENSSLTLAAEQPSSEIRAIDVSTNVHGTQHVPDVIVAARTEQSWGHLQLGGVVRQLGYSSNDENRRMVSGGAQLTGSFKVARFASYGDLLMLGLNWGKGVARYLNDLGGAGLDAVVSPDGKMHLLTERGAYAAYTHYWSDNWRSNLVYGVLRVPRSPWLSSSDFHDSDYGAANLIWAPMPALTVGLELLHGRLEVQDNRYNTDTRIQGSLQYSFIK